jgi:hypothetical protein
MAFVVTFRSVNFLKRSVGRFDKALNDPILFLALKRSLDYTSDLFGTLEMSRRRPGFVFFDHELPSSSGGFRRRKNASRVPLPLELSQDQRVGTDAERRATI